MIHWAESFFLKDSKEKWKKREYCYCLCDIYKQSGDHPTPRVNLIPLWIAELRLVHSGLLICSSTMTWHAQSQSGRHQVWNKLEPLLAFFGPHPGRFHLLPRVSNPPMEKHQLSWNKARVWALFYWMQEMIPHQQTLCLCPGNCHATDCLREKQLSAMRKTLPWQGLLSNGNMFQEEGGGAWAMLHSWKPPGMRLLVLIYSVTTKV